MKRVALLLLITALVCFLSIAFPALAQAEGHDVQAKLTVNVETEFVFVTASLTKNDGVTALGLRVEYDEETFELVESEFKTALSSLDPTDAFHDEALTYEYPYRISYIGYGENRTDVGDLFTLKFRVRNDAVNGKKKFSLYVYDMSYYDGASLVTPSEFEGEGGADPSGGKKLAEDSYVLSNGIFPSTKGNVPLIVGMSVGGGAILVLLAAAAVVTIKKKRTNDKKA